MHMAEKSYVELVLLAKDMATEAIKRLQTNMEALPEATQAINAKMRQIQTAANEFTAKLTNDRIKLAEIEKEKNLRTLYGYYKDGLISAEKYSSGVKAINKTAMESTADPSLFAKIKQNWVAVTAAVMGAWLTISKGIAVFQDVIDETVKLGTEVGKLQRITGMSAESASELIAVADQVGISFDTMQAAVVAVTRKMGGLKDIEDLVTDASGKSVDVFEKFGIVIKNTDGTLKPFSAVFEQIRTKIQDTSSSTERLAIATQFFRGSAAELMPLLTMTSEQYKEIAADAKKYGLILTQDNVTAVRAYVMAQRDMDDAIQGAKLALGKELIPVLTEAVKWLTENMSSIKEVASAIGTVLVGAVKVASGVLSGLAAIGLSNTAMFYEMKAAMYFLTGQVEKANEAHEMAKLLIDDAAKAAQKGIASFASLGEAQEKTGKAAEKAGEQQKKTAITYEQWYKNLSAGSEEYIKIKQKEMAVLEAHTAYEKALLDKSLADKTISMQQYLAAVKKLNDEEYQAKLKQIDLEIAAAAKGGEAQFAKLAELKAQRQVLVEKYATDEIKIEIDAAEKIKKIREDEFSAWKSIRELEMTSLKAYNDLKIAMDEEAVNAGVMLESAAMQNKLDMLKEQLQKEIDFKAESATKFAAMTGLITDKDKAEYEKLLAEKEDLQYKYEAAIIASESNITETQIKERQEAADFIAGILGDSAAKEEVEYQKRLTQLERYYNQGIISAEDYYKALDELESNHTSIFKAELKERSEQLNKWVELVQNRIQRTQDIIDSFSQDNFDDVKNYWGAYGRVMSESTDQVVWEINHLTQTLNGASYEVFWNASIFGKRMVQMVGMTVYEWMAKVKDYIDYVKGLMASLQDTIDGYRLQLMQLRGDRMGELNAWMKEETQKLEDQYKDELGKTAEYYEAKSLLDELYAEKKQQLLEEMKQNEEEMSNSSTAAAASGGGLSYKVPASVQDYFSGLVPDWSAMMPSGSAASSAAGGAATQTVQINADFNVLNSDSDYYRRMFEDNIWPLFQRKLELMGIKL